ncbi:serine/threonine-protein kinase [Actinoplanes siamensis]|uniref:non-specific serine/threonine protein kinase n=1 Tax=Actinoplanes siamensis TaxID=1223317 RepID=A0A919KD47_9ACTN|nr:serine/threonine-protein kinase [Actinoplanes siamensis]GIF03489.1 hypothetical protein Asi03nite_10270 [Actinoplanes siamensis]
MPTAGESLNGRYRLDERIAAGGMGEVWQATDTLLGRPVAVKMLLVERSGDPGFRQRFEHEARAMAAVRHPGVAAVHDFGTTGHGAYLVMARIDGQPLDRLIARRGRLSAEETTALVAQVAGALQSVHRAGIVHRDVTPGNLIVEPDGNVVLVDFGVARSALSVTLTGARNVIGTAGYMAPEQVAKKTVGPAADLYALGAVAYHCLAGRPPFQGGDAVSIAVRHVTDDPPPLPADVPERVRALVTRALEKDPARRHPSAAAMAGAARAATGGAPARLLATESDTIALSPALTGGTATAEDGRRTADAGRARPKPWLPPILAVLLAALSGAAAVVLVSDPFGWRTGPAATTPSPAPPIGSGPPSPVPPLRTTISGTTPGRNPPPGNTRTTRPPSPSRLPVSASAPSSSSPEQSEPPGGGSQPPGDGSAAPGEAGR